MFKQIIIFILIIGITTNAFGQAPSADSIAVRQASAQSDTLSQQY
jgi:hypothetical protein